MTFYTYICVYMHIGEVISTASCVFIFISDIASDVMLKLLLNFGGDRKSLSKSVLRAHVKTALDEQWSRLRFGGVSVPYMYVCICVCVLYILYTFAVCCPSIAYASHIVCIYFYDTCLCTCLYCYLTYAYE